MAFAFGHLIGAWLAGELVQKISNKKLPKQAWILLLLGGIIPDIDFIFQIILHEPIHRTITHSLFFAFFSLILTRKNKYGLFFSIGILIHIFLDLFTGPGVQLLWPFNPWISIYETTQTVSLIKGIQNLPLAIIDMGLGFIWFVYLYTKGKINL
ncbi:metal-dependent hydrolase [Candidatus Woesearchaeota archaeon]|jgi:membrane-bound metal-dependent hydrolase YbcI (DUF457 family)|nr:metal-dependent hydrolase [Candidatus Woesearchaeota archaeon]MBT7238178.1 metal-dependent hydrolase [Candidatus Woesearchaeota archaeon]